MKKVVTLLTLLFCSTALFAAEYGGKDHPYRVLMRDMKPHVKTLEKFAKDESLKDKALEACTALKELAEKGAKMKPEFLKADQHEKHAAVFKKISTAADTHIAHLKAGKIKEAQGMIKAIGEVKKEGHKAFKDQAKKARGADE